MKFTSIALITAVLIGGPVLGQSGATGEGAASHRMMMQRLPDTLTSGANPCTPAKVNLGRMLFYDARLSKDASISCNSCHDLEKYGVDGVRYSTGVNGQKGSRNSPTVYNAAGQIAQFWDGRAVSVEEQAKGPVLNPVEMAMDSAAAVESRLAAIPGYSEAFQKAFPGDPNPVTFDHVGAAIGAFERGLLTPSRWDQFVEGNRAVLSEDEFAGHREFMATGCASCHNGPFFGGRSLQKAGAVKEWPVRNDVGREQVTKAEIDHMVFKVPVLRNVAKTKPYFHDGSVSDLDVAVRRMGEYQLGIRLEEKQVRQIVAWLNTLTGEIPQDYIRRPALP